MKTPHLKFLTFLIGMSLFASACSVALPVATDDVPPGSSTTVAADDDTGDEDSGDDEIVDTTTTTTTTEAPPPVLDPAIDQRLRSFGPWTEAVHETDDGRTLSTDSWDAGDRVTVTCEVQPPRTFSPGAMNEFAAFPFNGDVLPGLIVEGDGVAEGDLRVIPLDRAPLPLRINLASSRPTVMVDKPDPSSLGIAVGELMNKADERLTGISVVPANIALYQQETNSYEEAMLQLGVSLRYDGPALQTEFKSDFEQVDKTQKRSLVVRFLQPMFTISTDFSGIRTPGDYFSPTNTADDVERLISDGRMGEGNGPVLIDSITYGRVVYMTVTSTKVEHFEKLEAAIEASYGGFSGDATVATEQIQILEDSEIQIDAYGGNQDVALNALKDGTIRSFMESVNTSTAAPLSMTFRTLDNRLITMEDRITINDIGCTQTVRPRAYALRLDLEDGEVLVKVNGSLVTTRRKGTHTDIPLGLRANSVNKLQLDIWPTTCLSVDIQVSILVDGVPTGGTWIEKPRTWEWACNWTSIWDVNTTNGTVKGPSNWTAR